VPKSQAQAGPLAAAAEEGERDLSERRTTGRTIAAA